MKNKIVAYDVYDNKSNWLAGYSTELDKKFSLGRSAYEMAQDTAIRHQGSCIEVRYENGLREKVAK